MSSNGIWTFLLEIESRKTTPSWVVIGLLENDDFHEQTRDELAFDWFSVSLFAV